MAEHYLVSPQETAAMAASGECVIFDCRFDLQHPQQGHHSWLAGHIPGAVYAHLDDHLAGRVKTGTGRHPLPNSRAFAAFLARSGWVPGMRVVAYDAHGGVWAARLWWLMKYFGHDCVALLDGGITAWKAASLPLEPGPVTTQRQPLTTLRGTTGMTMNMQEVAAALARETILLLDARDAERFAGLTEPLDSVAGHIPGARNHPFAGNLADGRFRSASELRQAYSGFLAGHEPPWVVHMCGSGVTACHNLLAMELAGLKGSRLYPGSWSEWITDPSRPVSEGAVRAR